MRGFFLLFVSILPIFGFSQGIHKEQLDQYNSLGITANDYDLLNVPAAKPSIDRAGCNLTKIVYGWHPYWSNGLQVNYDWSLLSHFCYFSYEVDASTGNALSTHSFSTTASVTDALANGVRVDLCVTLFSSHATLLSNAISKQNLIDNLISLISTRGAHGVNIDFEGLPLSQKTNFTNFMNDLANQMHAAIPGSQVSSVLYAVDWSDVIDVVAMTSVDFFVMMGYDYYWSGSSNAGPGDPLFHFSSTYNYTLSKSITYYLDKGLSPSKFVLGLPYYGREWPVASSGIPSATTGTGVAKFFNDVKDNISGNYSAANRNFDNESYSCYYEFNSGGLKQCFITEGYEMNKRMDLINKRGIAGMGIWALGYDDGYNDFWNAISDNFTDCAVTPCYDTLFDVGGGPNKNYYDDEDYTYTISPPSASQVTIDFSSFNLETGYDYLYLYDGSSTSAAQFPGSPFTGTASPGIITSSGGSITLRFTSDVSTVSTGFNATYQCIADLIAPTTASTVSGTWQTNNFIANFSDNDNVGGSGVNQQFYQVLDYDGTEWRANDAHGFFNDNFQTAIHPEWISSTGTWTINTNQLYQTNNAEANSNLYANLTQDNSHTYLYHWQMNMDGSGTNRRAGLHFFCDNPSLPNRGNSYFVYFRVDSDKCQIYEVNSDVFTLMADSPVTIDPATVYDCKVFYDPQTGLIKAYLNNVLVSEWTDPSPLASGNSISVRTGNTSTFYDDVKVYTNRTSSETISIGSSSQMVRFQNYGVPQNSCQLVSIINDNSYNWSNLSSTNVNIDWTNPASVLTINDTIGLDIDAQTDSTTLACEYSVSTDSNSDITEYWYSIGISPGDSSVVNWTNNLLNTNFTETGLALSYGQTYYINACCRNGAGLWSAVTSSDGITIVSPTMVPVCAFSLPVTEFCITDSILLSNTTIGANTYNWSGVGVLFNDATTQYPYVSFPSSGSYLIELIASGPGGTDSLSQSFSVTVFDLSVANFIVSDDTVNLPTAFVACTNTSLNASFFQWNFGDGNSSTDTDPWNTYDSTGIYSLTLIANNGFCPADTSTISIVVNGLISTNNLYSDFEIQVYPNPISNFLQIHSNTFFDNVYVTDISGKILHSLKSIQKINNLKLDFSNYAKGVYFIEIANDDIVLGTKRVIKN